MARVTDDMVQSFLTWGRNYGEIESFAKIDPGRGRCWKIVLPEDRWAHGIQRTPSILTLDSTRAVPTEIVLTAREALVFGYGLAVGGAAERREDFAAREWQWDD